MRTDELREHPELGLTVEQAATRLGLPPNIVRAIAFREEDWEDGDSAPMISLDFRVRDGKSGRETIFHLAEVDRLKARLEALQQNPDQAAMLKAALAQYVGQQTELGAKVGEKPWPSTDHHTNPRHPTPHTSHPIQPENVDAGASSAFFQPGDPSVRSASFTAELLGVSRQRVLALIQAGQLKAEKRSRPDGGREDWFVKTGSIEALLRSRMSGFDPPEGDL